MKKVSLAHVVAFSAALIPVPYSVAAQQGDPASRSPGPPARGANEQQSNVPPKARQIEEDVEHAVERFRIGVQGGVGLDPELVDFGAHAAFAPIFTRDVEFRPGIEFGLGEVTTLLSINLDVLYFLPGVTRTTRWMPYIGAGPTFGLSHRSIETDDNDDDDDEGDDDEDRNRFDFSDTDFNGGMNFIAGARNQSGLFFELRATAYGVSTIRLLAGFNF